MELELRAVLCSRPWEPDPLRRGRGGPRAAARAGALAARGGTEEEKRMEEATELERIGAGGVRAPSRSALEAP